MRRKLAAGNWKMNGLAADLAEIGKLTKLHPTPACDIMIAPPATLITSALVEAGDHALAIGAQDCHAATSGAHTGDISAEMLRDAGASYVILGHSERRADHGQTDDQVRAKTEAAHTAGLVAVVCVGETLHHRQTNSTLHVVGTQLAESLPKSVSGANTVVAYEPVWAIGTGEVATLAQIAEVHDFIRAELKSRFGNEADAIRLLYGGSVKPSNAAEIFAVSNVDGALVGGASLKAQDFSGIIAALDAA